MSSLGHNDRRSLSSLGHNDRRFLPSLGHNDRRSLPSLGHSDRRSLSSLGHNDRRCLASLGHNDRRSLSNLGHTDTDLTEDPRVAGSTLALEGGQVVMTLGAVLTGVAGTFVDLHLTVVARVARQTGAVVVVDQVLKRPQSHSHRHRGSH